MLNKRFLGMMAAVAVFGVALAGCGSDPEEGLNGTWIVEGRGMEFKIDNGRIEYYNSSDGVLFQKGAYTVDGDIITIQITQWRLGSYPWVYSHMSENEIREIYMDDHIVYMALSNFEEQKFAYTVNRTTLTLERLPLEVDGYINVYTRK